MLCSLNNDTNNSWGYFLTSVVVFKVLQVTGRIDQYVFSTLGQLRACHKAIHSSRGSSKIQIDDCLVRRDQ